MRRLLTPARHAIRVEPNGRRSRPAPEQIAQLRMARVGPAVVARRRGTLFAKLGSYRSATRIIVGYAVFAAVSLVILGGLSFAAVTLEQGVL